MSIGQAQSPFATIERVRRRSASAIVSWSGMASEPLRAHLSETLPERRGRHALMSDTVIEVANSWETAKEPMSTLAGRLLEAELVRALDGASLPDPAGRRRYRFGQDRMPFAHQLYAWRRLMSDEPQSVLVTSGTGSGKTECFLIPILNRLAQLSSRGLPTLTGVRALVLYPLNALINSQRERLSDWTSPFSGRIRYCLFNGETPELPRQSDRGAGPEEVRDRRTLRQNPPPILVTNITMLEYMLIRREDRPILDASQGKLEYIVLDEAHSYIGSQAAELALLLRRVAQAFGVCSENLRFVATSATIGKEGDSETQVRLRRFLADIGGVPESQVHVIEGRRHVPPMPPVKAGLQLPQPHELEQLSLEERYDRLGATPAFRDALDALGSGPATVNTWAERLALPIGDCEQVLELAAEARARGHQLLPLRVHAFHRTQPGLFVCIDPRCKGRSGTRLDAPSWNFGSVHHERIDQCPTCGGLVLELKLCSMCGNEALLAQVSNRTDGSSVLAMPALPGADDEFGYELADDDRPDEADTGEHREPADAGPARMILLAAPAGKVGNRCAVHRVSGALLDATTEDAVELDASDLHFCPGCNATIGGRGNAQLNSVRLGAPFLLGNIIPELLEDAQSPDGAQRPGGPARLRPAEGKQLLTFTDSRQGTARLSAKLQAEAERSYVRSFIYHAVQQAATVDEEAGAAAEIDKQIAALEQVLQASPASGDVLQRTLSDLRRTRTDLAKPKGVSWSKLTDMLVSDRIVDLMRDAVWVERDRTSFSSGREFARFLLLREYFRRPRRANSVETMGLARLQAPVIEAQTDAKAPREFVHHGGTIADWRDFLAIALTWYVRANSLVQIAPSLKRFIQRRIPTAYLISPSAERKDARLQRQWPSRVSEGYRLPLIVRLLMQGLKLDLANPLHRDDATAIMLKAWDTLLPTLQPGNDGYQLDFDRLEMMAQRQAWLCPVTRRVLDRTFRGLSPYPSMIGFQNAASVELPQLPFPFGKSSGKEVQQADIEDWLSRDRQVLKAREMGIWSDLHDAVVRRRTYFRAAEHSAQQPGWRLRNYEAAFRDGMINILNCSTTMEMGVDIGSIGTVAMTNVPPSLASYRQRVGRAGRSGQPMALGFTLCKDRPLDAAVFRNPTALLSRAMHAPEVRLDSPVIVQRHVNAVLLGAFLRERGNELQKMTAGPFYGCAAEVLPTARETCPSKDFVSWLHKPATRKSVEGAVESLLARTCLQQRTTQTIEASGEAMRHAETGFRQVWEPLGETAASLDETARKAIRLQQRRLEQTFVLSELAARGFLPAYGFPTDVVEFDNSNRFTSRPGASGADNSGEPWSDRGASRFAPRSLPARSLDLAIRDYAPGTDVVIDGLVYRSAGVSLAWRRPATADNLGSIEALGRIWRCEHCGAIGTSVVDPDHCSTCDSEDQPKTIKTLKPAGFTCDPFEPSHDEIEKIDFIPPSLPLVSAGTGSWVTLHDETLGRYRKSHAGKVVYHTMGAGMLGYAVCLDCGRAEPETSDDISAPLPTKMQGHRPLRSRPQQAIDRCGGVDRPFSVQRRLALAHEITTDVFELQLFEIAAGEAGRAIALPIGVALREALARWWGIEVNEVGVSVSRSRRSNASAVWSLLLFDNASGGAGFSTSVAEAIGSLLEDAARILDCPNGTACRSGCPDCILTRDVEAQRDRMDRLAAREFLSANVITRLTIPEADRQLGSATTIEFEPLEDAIAQRAAHASGAALTIWLPMEPWELDLAHWPAIELARKLTLYGTQVRFRLPATGIGEEEDRRLSLVSLMQSTGATVELVGPAEVEGAFRPLAHLAAESPVLWAVRTGAAASSEKNQDPWRPASCLLRRTGASKLPAVQEIKISDLVVKADAALVQIDIGAELDGGAGSFGKNFWRLIATGAPSLADVLQRGSLRRLLYTDRYLRAPLPVRLIVEILRHTPGLLPETVVRLTTSDSVRGAFRAGAPSRLMHDWARDSDRYAVTQALVGKLTRDALADFKPSSSMAHARILTLEYPHAVLRLHLDQGVGYWRPRFNEAFDFTSNAVTQAQSLLKASTFVLGDAHRPMPVWCRKV